MFFMIAVSLLSTSSLARWSICKGWVWAENGVEVRGEEAGK